MKNVVISAIFCFWAPTFSWGQLSPPGLEGAKVVSWGAIGFNQKLSPKWSTAWYVGGSEQSDPTNFATLKKAAIFILNQETYYQLNTHWQVAICTSLRLQDLYEEEAPYTSLDPAYRKELRHYLRLFYRQQKKNSSWAYSFRPEYRIFYTPDGTAWEPPVQVRFRLKGQVNIPINIAKTNQIIIANEWLTATNQDSKSKWTSLEFTEDRLSTFFRHTFKKPALFLDLGLMHQLWKNKEKALQYTTYLSFDLLFQNPFGQGKLGSSK